MSLIKCPECGKEISDKASACIHCGYPLGSNTSDIYNRKEKGEPFSICCKCRKKVSTRSEKCPHCGCVLVKKWYNDANICKVNGVDYDLTPFMQLVHPEGMEDISTPMKEIEDLTNCAFAGSIMGIAHRNGGILPKEHNGPTLDDMNRQEEENAVHCKYCGSTNVEKLGYWSGGWKATYGGLQWHCNNCDSDF